MKTVMARDEEEILLSQLLADDTKHSGIGDSSDDENDNAPENHHLQGPCGQEGGDGTVWCTRVVVVDDDDRSDINDYFSRTVQRLENHDPTLQTLELCNQMLWDFDRWRHPVMEEQEEVYILDVEAWLSAIAHILCLAQTNPQIVRLEFMNIPINHPTIVKAIIDLFTCDKRTWLQWTIEECDGFDARFLADAMAMSSSTTTKQTCRIRSLRLINNTRFSPQGMSDVGRIIATSTSLTELRVTENLDASAIINLSEGLVNNTTLSRLDFQGSSFEDDYSAPNSATGALAEGLRGLRNLLTLSFAYCSLSDYPLATLVRAVRKHSTLCWLDLSRNECGLESCQAITSLLVKSTDEESSSSTSCKLRGLTMNGCDIGDLGLLTIQPALAEPQCTLQHLHLCDNRITDDGLVEFLKGCSDQPSLCSLWLSGNDFGARGASELLKVVQHNYQLDQVVLDSYLACFREIQYFTLLNQGGRKLLQSDQHNVPLGLWPLVLERAQRIPVKLSTQQAGAAVDILYHLLQGPALSK